MQSLFMMGILRASLAAAAVVPQQIQRGDISYLVAPSPILRLGSWNASAVHGAEEFVPLTIIEADRDFNDGEAFSILQTFEDFDDVWSPEFMEAIYIQFPTRENDTGQGLEWAEHIKSKYGVSSIISSDVHSSNAKVPPGPYFLRRDTGHVHQAYRLYADTQQAFGQSTYQDSQGTHHDINVYSDIAVPSRLYSLISDPPPLAGLRLAVRDVYDLKGLKTFSHNEKVFGTGEAQSKTKTAASVQKLIDAGATVVGRITAKEFHSGPEGHLRIHSDRSAAALGSYDWLDASLESDSGDPYRGICDSVRYYGIHGNRASQSAMDMTGALVKSPSMDTSGILARSPYLWSVMGEILHAGHVQDYDKYPRSILVEPVDERYKIQSVFMAPRLSNFMDALVKITSGRRSVFDIDQAWNNTRTSGSNAESLNSTALDLFKRLTMYEERNASSTHAANDSTTEASYRQDLVLKRDMTEWAARNFLRMHNTTCSDSIFVYFTFEGERLLDGPSGPPGAGPPRVMSSRSRAARQLDKIIATTDSGETYTELVQTASSLTTPGLVGSIAGLPDYAITLGSVTSLIDGEPVRLPFSVDIMAAKGCDLMLLNLVKALYSDVAIDDIELPVKY